MPGLSTLQKILALAVVASVSVAIPTDTQIAALPSHMRSLEPFPMVRPHRPPLTNSPPLSSRLSTMAPKSLRRKASIRYARERGAIIPEQETSSEGSPHSPTQDFADDWTQWQEGNEKSTGILEPVSPTKWPVLIRTSSRGSATSPASPLSPGNSNSPRRQAEVVQGASDQ